MKLDFRCLRLVTFLGLEFVFKYFAFPMFFVRL
jgi:hypothetical protein